MLSILFSNPIVFLILFPGLLLAITVHEFAHAWAADHLGDPTPRAQGRLTLDPRAHLDPLGTLAILITRFGWGKPVQFDPYNLKEPVRDAALIALAGPVSNLILAVILSLIINFNILPWEWVHFSLIQLLIINVMLTIFNMLPVHPLDGGKVMMALLPQEAAYNYEMAMERYGTFILIFLIMPWGGVSPASQLISPVIDIIVRILI
ncbi:MAG: site-2 protease family protein [Candidatus Pacebacteria bacterium]|jgi:Zn-dependent protease|nr:site-2 protease family protein [Candidatus Paceibacterota bacterium]MBT3512037.1 site-2 protease family protein [Candidatus Paceibacterota bacterium]MBT4004467.1 site-2 protease family protein [Candidatus Paceibacterota bacterium]MBT4359068.1 site-2 protease family protein [Candidatus Paceibacterota bacterium]MBT4681363.1 site-2 protease family protein [Candidatus Paceibacterota bacterium]